MKDWPETLPLTSPRFGLFLALDARQIRDDNLLSFARTLVKQGLTMACVWGPDCERVHDRIDDAIMESCAEEDEPSVILTTWHTEENREEALEFFVETLEPATALRYSSSSRLAVSVGSEAYAETIGNWLKQAKRIPVPGTWYRFTG